MDTFSNSTDRYPAEVLDFLQEEPAEDATGKDTGIDNTMDVALKIHHIRSLEKQIEMYRLQADEAKAFFDDKIRKANERIDFVKMLLFSYLQQQGLRNLQTPYGTVYTRKVTKREWGDAAALLAWAKVHAKDAVMTAEEVDKRILVDHMKETGEAPTGYRQHEETRIHIK